MEEKETPQERYQFYSLKQKQVLFDTQTQTALLETESKEELIISMLVDLKNSLAKLETKLI
jgi:hypothetical protein